MIGPATYRWTRSAETQGTELPVEEGVSAAAPSVAGVVPGSPGGDAAQGLGG